MNETDLIIFLVLSSPEDIFFIVFREGKRGKKKGRETSIGCLLYAPQQETKPAT